jgi:hypothetical protein
VIAPAAAEAVRFSAARVSVAGLAYDPVSRRFLFADRSGRKVIVVGEGSQNAVDLVRADSAGFAEVSAVEIDGKRGDLWVASTGAADRPGSLHRLQLISGRPLKAFPASIDDEPATLVDLSLTAAGSVVALDTAGPQVLVLKPGAAALDRIVRLDVAGAVSITAAADERIAYVAHRDGVLRIDLAARTSVEVTAAKDVSLAGLERLRWHRNGLIGVSADAGGARQVVRLELNGAGRRVTRVTPIGGLLATGGDVFASISGDELVYLVAAPAAAAGAEANPARDFVAYRLKLR